MISLYMHPSCHRIGTGLGGKEFRRRSCIGSFSRAYIHPGADLRLSCTCSLSCLSAARKYCTRSGIDLVASLVGCEHSGYDFRLDCTTRFHIVSILSDTGSSKIVHDLLLCVAKLLRVCMARSYRSKNSEIARPVSRVLNNAEQSSAGGSSCSSSTSVFSSSCCWRHCKSSLLLLTRPRRL